MNEKYVNVNDFVKHITSQEIAMGIPAFTDGRDYVLEELIGFPAAEMPVWRRYDRADPETYPTEECEDLLISTTITPYPAYGRYEDGEFYTEGADRPMSAYGFVVNAWMPAIEMAYRGDGV